MVREKFLNELESSLSENQLIFECPACPHPHHIRIGFKQGYQGAHGILWSREGNSIDDLTVVPTIHGNDIEPTCLFHGRILNGMVSW